MNRIDDVRERIKNFKRNYSVNDGFYYYKKYISELNSLYWNYYENRQIISNERENLKKYIFRKHYNYYNIQAEKGNHSVALNTIKNIQRELPLSEIDFPQNTKNNYIKNMEVIKKEFEFRLKLEEAKEPMKNKNFEESIKSLKNLLYSCDSNNENQKLSINKLIKNANSEYIKNVTNQNMQLLLSHDNDNENEKIITNSENIIQQFKYDSDLNNLLHETYIVYAAALEEKIKEKEKKGEDCAIEREKLKNLKVSQNYENELIEFKKTIESNKKKYINSIDEDENSNEISNIDSEKISMNKVKEYLDKLKKLNEDKNNQ